MSRIPFVQIVAVFIGSSIILGLLVARGFVLAEHTRIMLGALTLVWLLGSGWNLATAVERAGGWRKLGAGHALLVVVLTALAAFAPALALALWGLAR